MRVHPAELAKQILLFFLSFDWFFANKAKVLDVSRIQLKTSKKINNTTFIYLAYVYYTYRQLVQTILLKEEMKLTN